VVSEPASAASVDSISSDWDRNIDSNSLYLAGAEHDEPAMVEKLR